MKASDRSLIVGAAIAFFFTLTLAAFAQEQPAPAPVVPPAEATPAVEPTPPTPPPGFKVDPKPKPSVASDVAAGFHRRFPMLAAGPKNRSSRVSRKSPRAKPRTMRSHSPENSTLRRIDGPEATGDDTGVTPANAGGDVIKIGALSAKGTVPTIMCGWPTTSISRAARN